MWKKGIIFSLIFTFLALNLVGGVLPKKEETIPSRYLADLNWIQVGKMVPSKINTVLLVAGTLEAHGVTCNGADFIVPDKLAEMIAPRINALIAPHITYGVTRTLTPYPGGIAISEKTFEQYVKEILYGLADIGFKNIIIINGHGPNRGPCDRAMYEVAMKRKVRGMVIDWWSYTADITKEVFNQDGGHAGINENAAVMAVNPKLVYPELYSPDKVTATPIDPSYSAYPSPSSILLYTPGEGYPEFNLERARKYLSKVADKLTKLIKETIAKWDKAGL
ncbi:MAG: creatininase family protein [Acidobacteria bacterium]|nr:creatininase family protein [Acidobacteriota bacterium]